MAKQRRYPELYDLDWWEQNRRRTDVDIAEELGASSSHVNQRRREMGIKPLSNSETSRRQWDSLESRKNNTKYPMLYEEKFWEQNLHKTNNEIADELGCSPASVKKAREFLGYRSLSPSEAQQRRYEREGLPRDRQELPADIRREVLERADHVCEVPSCNLDQSLEIHHLKRNSEDMDHLIVLCYAHHKWIEAADIDPDSHSEAKNILSAMFPET